MTVPQEALENAKRMLQEAKRPVFLHDDDCDGTSSFTICYQFCGEGKSTPIKRSPSVGPEFARGVKEYEADLVVILDKAKVEREFLEQVKLPVLWIDHHEPQTEIVRPFANVFYLNPRIWDDLDNRPTCYWCYKITGKNLWIATVGCVADWHIPEYITEFQKEYPDLLPERFSTVEELNLETPISRIIRVISFNLKGQAADVRKSILTLTRIESPYEILKQTTSRGRFLWKKYEKLAEGYDKLLAQAREQAKEGGRILAFLYTDDAMTFTAELANELLIRYPERVLIVGRHHDGRYKCSLRSKDMPIADLLAESIKGIDATGGGHTHAVGASVAEGDWETFYKKFSALVDERTKEMTKKKAA